MGGIFAEGIDLTEDRLIGAIIVGTGLPQVSIEKEVLQNYFDDTFGEGFLYAFLYPGMNKVMQSAGRVIRTVDDVGMIALLDDRFLNRDYTNTFPLEWKGAQVCSLDTVEQTLRPFWESFT
jgi:Rad3-related DNA helicase